MSIASLTSLEGPREAVEVNPRYKVRLTKEFETNKSAGELVHFTYRLTRTDQDELHDLYFEDAEGHLLKVATRTTMVTRSGTTVRHDLQLVRKRGDKKLEVYEIEQEAEDSLGDVLVESFPLNVK